MFLIFKDLWVVFGSVSALAEAPLDDVMEKWSGLGYYRRAANLHKTANILKNEFNSALPGTLGELIALPGIGRSTAGAILAIGMQSYGVIMEANVKRVISRFNGIKGDTQSAKTQKKLWTFAEELTPQVTQWRLRSGNNGFGVNRMQKD